MIPVREGFCYLRSIGGCFMGGGEEVRVYVEDGFWYLSGRSCQPSLRAEAIAVRLPR